MQAQRKLLESQSDNMGIALRRSDSTLNQDWYEADSSVAIHNGGHINIDRADSYLDDEEEESKLPIKNGGNLLALQTEFLKKEVEERKR